MSEVMKIEGAERQARTINFFGQTINPIDPCLKALLEEIENYYDSHLSCFSSVPPYSRYRFSFDLINRLIKFNPKNETDQDTLKKTQDIVHYFFLSNIKEHVADVETYLRDLGQWKTKENLISLRPGIETTKHAFKLFVQLGEKISNYSMSYSDICEVSELRERIEKVDKQLPLYPIDQILSDIGSAIKRAVDIFRIIFCSCCCPPSSRTYTGITTSRGIGSYYSHRLPPNYNSYMPTFHHTTRVSPITGKGVFISGWR